MTVAPKLMLAKLLTNLKPLKPDERQLIEKAAAREGTEAPETIRIFIDEDIEILVRNWDPNRLLADRWPEEITDLTEYFMSLNGVPCEIDGR